MMVTTAKYALCLTPLIFATSASAALDAKPSATPSGAGETAVVRPLDPEIIKQPAALKSAIQHFVADLSKEINALEARQKDVVNCGGAPGEARQADIMNNFGCLAGAAGEIRATWGEVGASVDRFETELAEVEQRIDNLKKTEAGEIAKRQGEETALKVSVANTVARLKQLQPQVKAGTLSADDELRVRKLLDDYRTARAQVTIVDKGLKMRSDAVGRLDVYVKRIDEARHNADALAHQAQNRASIWASVVDQLKSMAPFVAISADLSPGDLAQAGGLVDRLEPLRAFDPGSVFPDPCCQPPEPIPTFLPNQPLSDELDKVLGEAEPNVSRK
jgi:hypothetical protein